MGYDERIRLLYVACTRARDHLVVSLHRKARANGRPTPRKRTNAELLLDGMGDRARRRSPTRSTSRRAPALARRRRRPRAAEPRRCRSRQWARPSAVAATALADGAARSDAIAADRARPTRARPIGRPSDARPTGLQKRPRDLDLPPWLKGRYGTAVGRAVHGVLQTIDLATGDGLDAAVAAQCEAEAIPDRADEVARAGRATRSASPSVREAAAQPALARGLRLHARRRPPARGLRRPALPRRRRPGRRRLQDRRPPTTPPSSTAGSRATGSRARSYALDRRRHDRRAGRAG